MADAFNLLQMYEDDDDDDVEEKDSPVAGPDSRIEHLNLNDIVNNEVKDSDIEIQDDVDVSDENRKDIDQLDSFCLHHHNTSAYMTCRRKSISSLHTKGKGKASMWSKDVFDPHGYDESDFYDAIEAAIINHERERKEQERKKSQGGTVGVTPKAMLPSSGLSILPSGGSQSTSAESIPRGGRHNKKSKWDKVDGDRRSVLGGGHETLSAVGAHAALLSATNAGAGYATVYAQEKRREAEERRSSDRKADKRS